jgi:hypothetical protein
MTVEARQTLAKLKGTRVVREEAGQLQVDGVRSESSGSGKTATGTGTGESTQAARLAAYLKIAEGKNAIIAGSLKRALDGKAGAKEIAGVLIAAEKQFGKLDNSEALEQSSGGKFSTWFQNVAGVGREDISVEGLTRGQRILVKQSGDPSMLPRVLAHETAHINDRNEDGTFVSTTDPAMTVDAPNGVRTAVGEVAKEVFDYIAKNPNTKLTAWLNRAHSQIGTSLVGGTTNHDIVMREMFARLAEVYMLHPNVMAKVLPVTNNYMEARHEQIAGKRGTTADSKAVRGEVRSSPSTGKRGEGDGVGARRNEGSAEDREGVSGHPKLGRVLKVGADETAMPRLIEKAGNDSEVGLTAREVSDLIEEHLKESGRRPPIHLKDSVSDFPFALPANAYGALVDGEIWLNNSAFKTRDDVIETLRHEYTHYGLLAAYGKGLFDVMQSLYDNSPRVKAAADHFLAHKANAYVHEAKNRQPGESAIQRAVRPEESVRNVGNKKT